MISCLVCNKTREVFNYRIAQGRGKYCSKECFWTARKGVHVAPETEFKKGHPYGKRFTKGFTPWNKGLNSRPKCRDCGKQLHNYLAIYCKSHSRTGERSERWKGDKVGYSGIHHWIKKQLGKPLVCWYCKTTTSKKYHWANKSGKYKRDIKDWIRLCAKCHYFYDRDKEKKD